MFISSTIQSAYKELKFIIDKILQVYMYMYVFLYIALEIAEILLIKKQLYLKSFVRHFLAFIIS